MTNKIRVGAVSYLNTRPFIYGIEHSSVRGAIELSLHQPAEIAKMLLNGEIDLGLVPVSILPKINEPYIISDFGICCDGEVSSVVICSQVPLKDSEKLFIDYQSRTSAALTQILVSEYWKASPRMVPASPGYEKQVMGKYAGLFIGDRALKLKEMYDYVYDLGEAWKSFSGMPFVFACWVANKKLDENFINLFSQALQSGLHDIDKVIAMEQMNFPGVNVQEYLGKRIQYHIDADKKRAMNYFLRLLDQKQGAVL